jgi:hypothetical protein
MSVDLRATDGELLWMRAHRPDPIPTDWRLRQDGLDGAAYQRTDGLLVILSGNRETDGRRWLHVSCSYRNRLPTWDDLRAVKDAFVGPDRYACQVFPPRDRYVNIGPFVLHLWSPLDGEWPL